MTSPLRQCAEALQWSMGQLRALVHFGGDGDVFVRGTELVGFARRFHAAADTLALPAVRAALAGEGTPDESGPAYAPDERALLLAVVRAAQAVMPTLPIEAMRLAPAHLRLPAGFVALCDALAALAAACPDLLAPKEA